MRDETGAATLRALPEKELGATKAEAMPAQAAAATTAAAFMLIEVVSVERERVCVGCERQDRAHAYWGAETKGV